MHVDPPETIVYYVYYVMLYQSIICYVILYYITFCYYIIYYIILDYIITLHSST